MYLIVFVWFKRCCERCASKMADTVAQVGLRLCTDSDWVVTGERKAFSACNYIHNKLHFYV